MTQLSSVRICRQLTCTGLLAALLTVTSTPALAAGEYAIRGAGVHPCSTYTEAVENDPSVAAIFVSWLAGYVTAYSMMREDTFDASFVTSTNELAGLLNDLCLSEPDQQVEVAALSLLEALAPARVQRNSDLVRIGFGEQQVVLRSETMRLIQQRLAADGYYRGAIDGEYGPQLAVALRRYQQANDLRPTSIPDTETVIRLLLDLGR